MIGSKFGSFVSLTHVKCPGKLTLIYLLHERTGARQTSSATGEEKQRYKIKLTCIRIRTELKTKEKYHSVGRRIRSNHCQCFPQCFQFTTWKSVYGSQNGYI